MGGLTFGSKSRATREAVWRLTNGRCFYCGAQLAHPDVKGTPEKKARFHVDHVIPRSRGGVDHITNLVPACPECNMSKNGSLLYEWEQRAKPAYPFGRHPNADVKPPEIKRRIVTDKSDDLRKRLYDAEVRAGRHKAEVIFWKQQHEEAIKARDFWMSVKKIDAPTFHDPFSSEEMARVRGQLDGVLKNYAKLQDENTRLKSEVSALRSEVARLKKRRGFLEVVGLRKEVA